jgi:hypothetical protein
MIENEPARRRFTHNAKEKVRNEMSLEAMLGSFAEFYQSLGNTNGQVAKEPG